MVSVPIGKRGAVTGALISPSTSRETCKPSARIALAAFVKLIFSIGKTFPFSWKSLATENPAQIACGFRVPKLRGKCCAV